MAKLFFSRYTITSGGQYTDKFDFLLNGLKNEASTTYRNYVYRFFDTEVFEFEGKDFIAGHLVKYNPEDMEEVVDETTRKLRDENLRNKVEGKARFIIDPSSSILMFFEVSNVISKNTFIDKFCKLFEGNHGNYFTQFYISPIKEQYSFIEKVRSFKAVKKIVITLFPSNPNFADRWKSIDERLRRNNISKYKEIQENTKPESQIIVDEETESKFLMSEDGYGKSDATGITENGEEKTISTKDSEKIVTKPVPNDLQKAVDVLRIVAETLQEIVNRTK
jgi:hypothetical protein